MMLLWVTLSVLFLPVYAHFRWHRLYCLYFKELLEVTLIVYAAWMIGIYVL
jgi:hypothetical protein